MLAVIVFYGELSFALWITIFHVTLTARIYLIPLPKYTGLIFLIIGYGSFSLVSVIVGLALDSVGYSFGITS